MVKFIFMFQKLNSYLLGLKLYLLMSVLGKKCRGGHGQSREKGKNSSVVHHLELFDYYCSTTVTKISQSYDDGMDILGNYFSLINLVKN
jgi:hypothetical protein